jgi:hypothetical protein
VKNKVFAITGQSDIRLAVFVSLYCGCRRDRLAAHRHRLSIVVPRPGRVRRRPGISVTVTVSDVQPRMLIAVDAPSCPPPGTPHRPPKDQRRLASHRQAVEHAVGEEDGADQ